MALQKATTELCVSHSNLVKWTVKGIGNINSLDKILKSKKKATHKGPLSQLKSLDDALLRYIFELRKQGVIVNTFIVLLFLLAELCANNYTSRCSGMKRFFVAHLFAYQMGTHTSQHVPAEVKSKAFNFMVFMHHIIFGVNCDRHFVINMDRLPVYFSMNAKRMLKRTLKLIKKTIHIHTLTDNTKPVTMAVTICADGTLLPSVLVFKGQPNDRFMKKEFPSGIYPPNHFYHCQLAVWMDKTVMIVWVKPVLKPYVAMAPDHIVPIVILDMYQCHMMALVVQIIQELGAEVQHIPGGCTSLCQPINAGFNKPFKDCMQWQWINWMLAEDIVHGTTSPLLRADVANWVNAAMAEMKAEGRIIRNIWRRHGYEWFVGDKDVGDKVVGGNREGEEEAGLIAN